MLSLLAAAALALGPPAALALVLLSLPLVCMLVAAATAGAALVRALARLRRRSSPPSLAATPPADPGTDAINAAIAALWPLLLETVEASAGSALTHALPASSPLPLAVRLRLAGPPPRLDRFAVTPPDGAGPLALDASVAWTGGVEVDVGLPALRTPAVAVGAAVDAVAASVRAELTAFSPGPPSPSATLRVSLPAPPELSVSTWAGGPALAGFLPALDAWVEAVVRDALCGPLVAPGGLAVDLPPGSGGGPAARGVAVVDVLSAADVPPALAGPMVVLVALPGGRAVSGGGGGGAASVASAPGTAADFGASPPAAFLVPPGDGPCVARVSLYATARGGVPVLVGCGEVEEGEAGGEGGAWVGLTKAGARPPTPAASPRRLAADRRRSPVLRPRLRVRLVVGRPGSGGGGGGGSGGGGRAPPASALTSHPPRSGSPEDWLGGGVLRVGLAAPPPMSGGRAPPPSLARLVEARAGGRTARLGEGGGGGAAAFALPASSIPSGSLSLAAWDWGWAMAQDAPLSFTRPGVGRTGPATLALPLARLVAAPGGRTTGVFGLGGGGAPPGVRPAVALDVRWSAFVG